jgi:hypothetical protein
MKHIKVFESFVPEELNEISSETIKSAADIAMSQGQPGRVGEMLKTHFYNYIGKQFQDGILTDITVKRSHFENAIASVSVKYTKEDGSENIFYYDSYDDSWNTRKEEIGRREANLLSEIAVIMNPQTKYKIATQNLPIKGYGMEM